MIEMRWRKDFIMDAQNTIIIQTPTGGYPVVLQYREMPKGTIPGLIETEWLDVEIEAV